VPVLLIFLVAALVSVSNQHLCTTLILLHCEAKIQAMRQLDACQLLTARKIIANVSLQVIVAIICIVSLISSTTANSMLEDPSLSSTSPMNQPATGDYNASWKSVVLMFFCSVRV
jgi:hypothetical protein